MYYTNNTFWVDVQCKLQSDLAPILPWLRALDADAREALRCVRLLVHVVYIPFIRVMYLGWDSRSRSHDYAISYGRRFRRCIEELETAEGTLHVRCRRQKYVLSSGGEQGYLDRKENSDLDVKSMRRGLMRGKWPGDVLLDYLTALGRKTT
ncbi:hypothetical protein LTR53_001676 [Teratosphaeriaceae sp. CCFEE 6253]|nr:hypothetical protein LTR53_001676 [Teratosphaeriaceae sp. CCFEE 6253]